MAHHVDAGFECGLEVIDERNGHAVVEPGAPNPIACVGLVHLELVEVEAAHVAFVEIERVAPHDGRGHGERPSVHHHGEVRDVGMCAAAVEAVHIAGRVGFEAHQERLLRAGVEELVVHVDVRRAVVAPAEGEDFPLHADVALHEWEQLVAGREVAAVVGPHRPAEEHEQAQNHPPEAPGAA